jgi:hypothetical protein
MKASGYLCTASVLAGLLVWVISALFEPRVYFLAGVASGISIRGQFIPATFSVRSPSDGGFLGITGPQGVPAQVAEDMRLNVQLVNETKAFLAESYGPLLNISSVAPAVLEGPGGRKVGVAFVLNYGGGRRLVLVMPDGWIGEYSIPG